MCIYKTDKKYLSSYSFLLKYQKFFQSSFCLLNRKEALKVKGELLFIEIFIWERIYFRYLNKKDLYLF